MGWRRGGLDVWDGELDDVLSRCEGGVVRRDSVDVGIWMETGVQRQLDVG